jgi:predicted secreted protein
VRNFSGRRRFLGATLFFLSMIFLASPVRAGDTASLDVIGYSKDGHIFAFEGHGVQDGSGFAYSNYFFIDTREDKYLPGTPIRVLIEEEQSVKKIRNLARTKAQPLIDKYDLTENPGVMVAYNPGSEIDGDPHKIRYTRTLSTPARGITYTLELKQKVFPPTETCLDMIGEYSGFTLTLTENSSQPAHEVLHDDAQVPKSRSCPNGYRIGAVIGSETAEVPQIAMIMVATYGFEGNDERWIAVPFNPAGP